MTLRVVGAECSEFRRGGKWDGREAQKTLSDSEALKMNIALSIEKSLKIAGLRNDDFSLRKGEH